MNYFYGPVPSRRLGFSLGVNLFPKKVCSFDCLYCQLGSGGKKVIRRLSYANLVVFRKSLKQIIKRNLNIDYITISGSGEPTLHKDLDKIIKIIREVTKNKIPICLITNSSLLYRKDVRRQINDLDLIIPSLDATLVKTFNEINRPHEGVKIGQVIDGLINLRKEFKGKIWLEIMFVSKINDTREEVERLKKLIRKINPDKVQLNIPLRPNEAKLILPNDRKLKNIALVISEEAEVIADFGSKGRPGLIGKNLRESILGFLKIRPARKSDLVASLEADNSMIKKEIKTLLQERVIKEYLVKKNKYFIIND